MATQYIDKSGKTVDLSSFGDADAQNLQANKMGYDLAPSNVITPESLTPTPPVNAPIPTLDTTNYSGMTTGGQTIIDATNKNLETPEANPLDKYLADLKANAPSATANVDAYNQALGASGYSAGQQDVLAQQTALKNAQAKLGSVNARLAGLNAEAKVAELKAGESGETLGFAAGETARVQRQAAIRALPLQAEALGAQAEVQAAQGNVELSQETLRLAQNQLNTVFSLHTKDIEAQQAYKKSVSDAVYAYATAEQKAKLDAKQKLDDQNFQLMKDSVNNAQTIAKTAMDNGQSSLASQITALDPKSKTYTQDLARLQGQIRIPQKVVEETISTAPITGQKVEVTPIGSTPTNDFTKGALISSITKLKLSEGQSNAVSYAIRLIEANKNINDLISGENGYDPTGVTSAVGRRYRSDNARKLSREMENFIRAQLRKESGAQIADSELEGGKKIYDPSGVLTNKADITDTAATRLQAIQSMVAQAGPAGEYINAYLQSVGTGGQTETSLAQEDLTDIQTIAEKFNPVADKPDFNPSSFFK